MRFTIFSTRATSTTSNRHMRAEPARVLAFVVIIVTKLLVASPALADTPPSNHPTINQTCQQLWQFAGAGDFVPGENAIVLSGLANGSAYFTRVAQGHLVEAVELPMQIDEIVQVREMDLTPETIAGGVLGITEMEITGSVTSTQGLVLPVSLWVWRVSVNAEQVFLAFPHVPPVSQPQLMLAANGSSCEAGCLATRAALDAVALATYTAALATAANALQACINAAPGSWTCLGIGGSVVICPPCGVGGYLACVAAQLLVCADAADTSRTAAMGVLEAVRNANAVACGLCIQACRAAAGNNGSAPATPVGSNGAPEEAPTDTGTLILNGS